MVDNLGKELKIRSILGLAMPFWGQNGRFKPSCL
jgi:hypothetical protein